MSLKQSRLRTKDGYQDTLVYKISYKKGETVTAFYPGTVYQLRKRNFRVETSQITGEEFLVAKRAFAWRFTYKQCPTCFSQMCESYISTGQHSCYRS